MLHNDESLVWAFCSGRSTLENFNLEFLLLHNLFTILLLGKDKNFLSAVLSVSNVVNGICKKDHCFQLLCKYLGPQVCDGRYFNVGKWRNSLHNQCTISDSLLFIMLTHCLILLTFNGTVIVCHASAMFVFWTQLYRQPALQDHLFTINTLSSDLRSKVLA